MTRLKISAENQIKILKLKNITLKSKNSMDRYNTVEITEERMLRKYPRITVTLHTFLPFPTLHTNRAKHKRI